MLMEAQTQETLKHVPTSPTTVATTHSDQTTDPTVEEKTAPSDNKTASVMSGTPSATGRPQRNLPGTKDEGLYQWPQRPLESIESAFALREYLQSLIPSALLNNVKFFPSRYVFESGIMDTLEPWKKKS
ncbi:hypothetical protein KI688_002253 [Linnemannia hyalina]|uniref:Uncharacterized protein n=1 Tax=Linnemannia hyalina TaxID=64524 RepID=A0A9P7XUG0_9FUNG|nr:hypothetical protein KI688_002253 [Linnemannia hyalina]